MLIGCTNPHKLDRLKANQTYFKKFEWSLPCLVYLSTSINSLQIIRNFHIFQKLVKPVLVKALENCARQPSQVAIVTEAVHAAACLIRMASADEAGTAGRAEKTVELAKLLNVESGAEKQVCFVLSCL